MKGVTLHEKSCRAAYADYPVVRLDVPACRRFGGDRKKAADCGFCDRRRRRKVLLLSRAGGIAEANCGLLLSRRAGLYAGVWPGMVPRFSVCGRVYENIAAEKNWCSQD